MRLIIPAALSLLLAPAWAQDAEPMTEEHAALRAFVGHWNTQVTLRAPGKPVVATSLSERFELVCNGLWLKRIVGGAQTVSLIGFDPHAKTWVSVEASSTAAAASRATGSFDAATKTWTWRTIAGAGPARSTGVWRDDDTFVETGYGDKDTEVQTITRSRVDTDAPAAPAPAGGGAAPAVAHVAVAELASRSPRQPMHAELGTLVGRWDAVTTTSLPGAPPSQDQGKEVNSAVCDGLWVWSDFDGTLSDKPFEGHALIGYDPASARVVTYWIDSSTAALSIRTGSFDAKTRTLTATGTACDAAGKPLPLRETAVWTDSQTRSQVIRFGSGERAVTIEIAFTRDMQLPDHRIR